jgi:hypothetical protein
MAISGVTRLQGGRPAAIFSPFGLPMPFAYVFKNGVKVQNLSCKIDVEVKKGGHLPTILQLHNIAPGSGT